MLEGALFFPVSAVSAYAAARLSAVKGRDVPLSNRNIVLGLILPLICVFLLASGDKIGLPMDVIGMHMAALWISVIVLLSSVGVRSRSYPVYVAVSALALTILMLENLGRLSFYYASSAVILISAAALLFCSDRLPGCEGAPRVSWKVAVSLILLMSVAMAATWMGCVSLGCDFSVNQYVVVQYAAFAFTVVEMVPVILVYRRRSLDHAVCLAMYIMALDLAMGFFLAVASWHRRPAWP